MLNQQILELEEDLARKAIFVKLSTALANKKAIAVKV